MSFNNIIPGSLLPDLDKMVKEVIEDEEARKAEYKYGMRYLRCFETDMGHLDAFGRDPIIIW